MTTTVDAVSFAAVLLIGGFSVWMAFWARIPIGGSEEEGRK